MMIVWGSRMYGRVDEIPGMGHVATRFGHFMFLPLFPMESFFVMDEKGSQFMGEPIELSLKSVLAGYAYAYSIVCFFAGMGALHTIFNPTEGFEAKQIPALSVMLTLGVFSIPTFIVMHSRRIRLATYETARNLIQRIDYDGRLRVCVEHHFGNINDEQADELFDSRTPNKESQHDSGEFRYESPIDPNLAHVYQ